MTALWRPSVYHDIDKSMYAQAVYPRRETIAYIKCEMRAGLYKCYFTDLQWPWNRGKKTCSLLNFEDK